MRRNFLFITLAMLAFVSAGRGQGTITTSAGNGSFTSSGDGGPATSASIGFPAGVAVDSAGNIYIADAKKGRSS